MFFPQNIESFHQIGISITPKGEIVVHVSDELPKLSLKFAPRILKSVGSLFNIQYRYRCRYRQTMCTTHARDFAFSEQKGAR